MADANPNNSSLSVDILIGADHYWKFFSNEIIRATVNVGPVAINSKLSFILSGPCSKSETTESATNVVISMHSMKICNEVITEKMKLSETMNKFWDLEALGIKPGEQSVYEKFTEDIKCVNGRYEVKLPFKEHHDILHDNYNLAKTRLKGQWNKFKNNHSLFDRYNSIFQEQLSLGIIERVASENNTEKPSSVHYLRHRPVVREDKYTTKVRAVFDASAKKDGASLNECLYTGPSLTPSLYGVLLRFRAKNIAFMSDIEKAFLQISIEPKDRDFLRFLWFQNYDNMDFKTFENNSLTEFRLCRVLFGATCSPFLLTATLITHFEQYRDVDPLVVEKVLSSLHVDDLISGEDNDSAVVSLFSNVKQKLKEGGFNLRKFASNSINAERIVSGSSTDTRHDLIPETKVLGIVWNKMDDQIIFKISDIVNKSIEPVIK